MYHVQVQIPQIWKQSYNNHYGKESTSIACPMRQFAKYPQGN